MVLFIMGKKQKWQMIPIKQIIRWIIFKDITCKKNTKVCVRKCIPYNYEINVVNKGFIKIKFAINSFSKWKNYKSKNRACLLGKSTFGYLIGFKNLIIKLLTVSKGKKRMQYLEWTQCANGNTKLSFTEHPLQTDKVLWIIFSLVLTIILQSRYHFFTLATRGLWVSERLGGLFDAQCC